MTIPAPDRVQAAATAWPADRVERWDIARLTPYVRNARTHSDEQVAQIAASIEAFGFTNPVLADEAGTIIAGHGRVLAAQRLGLADIPVMVARDWSEAQIRAYLLADNKLALNAGWDTATLALELGELNAMGFDLALTGFSDAEIADLMAAPETVADDCEADGTDDPADAEAEPPRATVTRPGDLWLLGEHRLLCGDSSDAEALARLMGSDRAALLFTSPPYGNQRNYTTGGIGDWDALMRGVFARLSDAMAPDVKTKVDMALGSFQTLANTLSASPGSMTMAGVANDVLAASDAVMADLPPGTLPPNVVAAVTAGGIVAHAVLAIVEQQSSAPG